MCKECTDLSARKRHTSPLDSMFCTAPYSRMDWREARDTALADKACVGIGQPGTGGDKDEG